MHTTPSYPYPERPKNINESVAEPSLEFRKKVIGVLFSIILFIVTYLALVLVAIALSIACGYAGYWIITTIRNLWAIIFGVAFACMGVMVLYFLFKFVFKSSTINRSKMREVTAKEQPLLFDFLQRIAKETQTPVPKKVYISPEVNAFVFYNSSFWSMFFPVQKNLCVGLGLVNCVSISEFKAVIAHEFGHFSQRSMKLGSYVYNVNHVIYDMLFDNRDYEDTLKGFAEVSSVFMVVAAMTGVIVQIIKEILEKVYAVINERFMALSQQMEFHADAVAAKVSGSKALIQALYRFDIAQACYHSVLANYDDWVPSNRKGVNVYDDHNVLMRNFAGQYNIPLEHDRLKIDASSAKRHRVARVIIKDQWASHPSTPDRENHLNALAIHAEEVQDSAWTLFTNAEQLQKDVTNDFYVDVKFQQIPDLVDSETFRNIIDQQDAKYSFDKDYKGFYDGREITVFNPELIYVKPSAANQLTDILTEETIALKTLTNSLTADINILESIQPKSSTVKTFDFEGRKYNRNEGPDLLLKLKAELKTAVALLETTDKELFLLYYKKDNAALDQYKEMFSVQQETEEQAKKLYSMINEANQLYYGPMSPDMATMITNNMTREGKEVKAIMRKILEAEKYTSFYSPAEKTDIQSFVDNDLTYFSNKTLDAVAIKLHIRVLSTCARVLFEYNFHLKKKVLHDQFRVIEGNVNR